MSENVKIKLQRPHDNQQKIIDAYFSNRYEVLCVCAGRRFGKTTTTFAIAVNEMLNKENFRVLFIAQKYGKCLEFFKKFLPLIPSSLIENLNKSDLEILLKNGSYISFKSGHSRDAMDNGIRGNEGELVIADECSFYDFQYCYEDIISPFFATIPNGKLIVISTPQGQNYFYKLWMMGYDNNHPMMKSFHFTSYDNPFVRKDYLARKKKEISSETWEQEYMANPASSKGNPFKNNIQKNVIDFPSSQKTVVIGIDVGKEVDYTTLVGVDINGNVTFSKKINSESYTVIQKQILQIKNEHPSALCVIEINSVGNVVYDNIVYDSDGNVVVENVVKWLTTAKSKTQIILRLIKDVEDGNVKYTKDIASEMSTFSKKVLPSGYVQYGAQSGFHDDLIMAYSIANDYRKSIDFYSEWVVESI